MGNARTLDTGTDFLLGEVTDGVATLSFNRPDRRNALHHEVFAAFGKVLPELAVAEDVGAIVVTGVGNSFSAGGDVRAQADRAERAATGQLAQTSEGRVDELRRNQRAVSLALHNHPKVTIAALPGAAAGAGLSIALACDLRIAAASAFVTTAFVKVGFSGDFGGSWFLTQLVGAAKARELYLTSDRVSAEECLRLGLVNCVVPDDELRAAAHTWAASFANGPTLAYRYVKENLNRALVADVATCLDAEAVAMTRTGQSDDHREAARAFVEKRGATFTGR